MKPAKRLSTLLFILALFLPLQAQAITPVSFPYFHVTDPSTGMPLVGGLVWSYVAGTSTQSATYTDIGFSVPNAFPIVQDSDGNSLIYINGPTKLVVEYPPFPGNTHGAVIFTIDNLEAAPYNSYITVGPTVPPTPGTDQLSLYCVGTTLYIVDSTGAITSPATSTSIQQQSFTAAAGGGTGDAITANFTPAITSLVDKTGVWVWASAANTTPTPTFSPNGLVAKTIVKGSNAPLIAGDIPGANALMLLEYNATLDKWVLANPKYPFIPLSAAMFHNMVITVTGNTAATITADNNPFAGGGLSLSLNAGATGANGLDTGSLAAGTWYYVYVCNGSSGTCGLLSLSSTSPTAPGGYNNALIRVGAVFTVPNEYVFTITSATARAGATYTNNGQTFTVTTSINSINGGTTLTTYGTGAPAASGTLTYVSGNPTGNITYSANTAYTSAALFGTIQRGRRAQYVVGGPNVTTLPAMMAGALGSISTPTWVAVSVSGFVPPTAGTIRLSLIGANGQWGMAAPNSNYGSAYGTIGNPPPLVSCFGSTMGDFVLESNNVYYAGDNTVNGLFCIGWTDNL